MTRVALSRRDRRALALGAAILAPALLWVGVVKPYAATLAASRALLATDQGALERERALLRLAPRRDALRAALDSARHAMAGRLLASRDDGIAGAELTAHLARLARANDVWLQEAIARGVTTSPSGVRSLAVDIRAESDFAGILDFLAAVERGETLVRLERVSIAPAPVADSTNAARALTLRATAIGYALGEPGAADARGGRAGRGGRARGGRRDEMGASPSAAAGAARGER